MDPMDIVGKSKEDASLPKGKTFVNFHQQLRIELNAKQYVMFSCDDVSATMTKIIKEMLPADVRVARDAQDLLIECCVGNKMITLLISLYQQV